MTVEAPGSRARFAVERLHGWGEFDETAVNGAGLRVEHDEVPPRHASIVGWPMDVSERKQRQQLLARRSRPVRLVPPIQVEKTADGRNPPERNDQGVESGTED